jgi:hypothetical protein
MTVVNRYFADHNGSSVTKRILFELTLVLVILFLLSVFFLLFGLLIIFGILTSLFSIDFFSYGELSKVLSVCILFLIISFSLFVINDQIGPLKSLSISKITFFRLFILKQILLGEKRPLFYKIKTLFLINIIRNSFIAIKNNLEDVYVAVDYENDIKFLDMIIDTLTHIRSISYSTEYRESVVSFVETLIEYYAITVKKKYGLGSEAFKEELITEILTFRKSLYDLMFIIRDFNSIKLRDFDIMSVLNKKWLALICGLGFGIIFLILGFDSKEFWAATVMSLFFGVVSWVLSIKNNK